MFDEITIERALEEARDKEQLSYDFYMKLLNYVKDLGTKAMIEELAIEELSHKRVLDDVLNNKEIDEIRLGEKCYLIDLGLTKMVRPEVVTENMTMEAVLRIAIKHEELTRQFYENIAERFKGNAVENIFKQLSHEEMCHRNNIQMLYDDLVFKEN